MKTAPDMWHRVPHWWCRHHEMNADLLSVLVALASYADANGVCFPSQGRLGVDLKRSRAWVNKTISDLEKLGFLLKVRRENKRHGGETSCEYRLVYADPAIAGACNDHAYFSTLTRPVDNEDTNNNQNNKKHTQDKKCVQSLDDWEPSEEDMKWASSFCSESTLVEFTRRFKTRIKDKSYKYADLSAGWRTWLKEDVARLESIDKTAMSVSVREPVVRNLRSNDRYQRMRAWSDAITAFNYGDEDECHRS